eukprot:Tbor_TRINITY_DN5693_c1_g3::TRINITY_DN5693_c1_g3_i1::g.9264::m.9264
MPFNESICGCFGDPKQCCDTICCTTCQVGRQCSAIEGQPNSHNCMWCCISCFTMACMPMCLRCKVSEKFKLEEVACTSCLIGWCCPICSLCATGRELNFRGINPG